MGLSFDQPPVPGGEGPERDEGGSDEVVLPHRSPVTGVERIVGIIAKGEVAAPQGKVRSRAAFGEKPFLICRDITLTYADADRMSNRVANSLIAKGIVHGDVVATVMYNAIEQALIWFGCAKIGAIYASLNVSLKKEDLAYSLNDTGAKILVVDEELALIGLDQARNQAGQGGFAGADASEDAQGGTGRDIQVYAPQDQVVPIGET